MGFPEMSLPQMAPSKNAAQPASDRPTDRNDFPRPLRAKSLIAAATVALAALAMIPFARHLDAPIDLAVQHLPLAPFTALAKQISNGVTVLLLAVVIWLMDPRRRGSLAVLLAALLLAMTVNHTIKMITGRARPKYGLEMGDRQKEWIADYAREHPRTSVCPEPEDQWIGLHVGPVLSVDPFGSFPSGHATGAFVTAAYLSALYPQARVVWYCIAAGCGVARIKNGDHYASDSLFGAATGWIVAQIVFSWLWPVRLGKRFFGRTGRS